MFKRLTLALTAWSSAARQAQSTSTPALLQITIPAPTIIAQPSSASVRLGSNVTFLRRGFEFVAADVSMVLQRCADQRRQRAHRSRSTMFKRLKLATITSS
jgi:hypothetical protein